MNLAGDLQDTGVRKLAPCQSTQSPHSSWVQYGAVGEIPAEGRFGVHFVHILAARASTARENQFHFARRYDQMLGNN